MWACLTGSVVAYPCTAGSKEDAKAACLQLLGTYAEPDDPRDAEFTVKLVKGRFCVVDCWGKKEIVEVKPTDKGLVFVEGDRDRNAFRLSYDARKKVQVAALAEETLGRFLANRWTGRFPLR